MTASFSSYAESQAVERDRKSFEQWISNASTFFFLSIAVTVDMILYAELQIVRVLTGCS
jgi:hypothetical protein